ncbi:Do family serine endopeptidase [Sphingomonas immobilis]|uniref:Probable periplasmic serine endoprotease DegP-like n=1 Tax=Sphingomonas immobilis TaxID=3063997 RepID=A0ABT9A078_9SPHN|nr:Do family serine endopeptidase [Sphingomonas sp. CA1-15]MDO7843240.1 Do family serine endopeptidase [Sphingomonas sp. CA1-15]
MRYAYAITAAILLSGTAAAVALEPPMQTAQNEPGVIAAAAPKAGAPMSFADMVARLQPAVVNISTTQHIKVEQQPNPFAGTPFGDLFGQMNRGQGGNNAPTTREATSLGSGFIVSADGYIVTNNHVVAPGAKGATVDTITVTLIDRKEYVAKLVGRDPTSDLALLKIEGKSLPFVKFGDSDKARVGDWIVAIGNPFGIGSTVTAGIVSALHRVTGGGAYDRFIQTDAAINQGNSGGPMFDLNGNVIGINSQIFAGQSGGNIGIGFAIPAEDAKPVIDKLMKGTKIARGYLGVGPQPIDDDLAASFGLPKNHGEILRSIEPGEAAAKAGLKVGDVVTSVGGKEVSPDQSLSYLVANVTPGTKVDLGVIRQGKPITVAAVIGTRPSEDVLAAKVSGDGDDDGLPDEGDAQTTGKASANALGLTVQTLTPQIARSLNIDSSVSGVVIATTDPSTDAGQKLKRGDVIVSANGVSTTTPAALAAVVAQAKAAGRDQVALYLQRGRNPAIFVGIKLKK